MTGVQVGLVGPTCSDHHVTAGAGYGAVCEMGIGVADKNILFAFSNHQYVLPPLKKRKKTNHELA